MSRIAFDMDGVITIETGIVDYLDKSPNLVMKELENFTPNMSIIQKINHLYTLGHTIYIYTARNDVFQKVTKDWLKKYGVKYHYFVVNKQYYDLFIEDKSIKPQELLYGSELDFLKQLKKDLPIKSKTDEGLNFNLTKIHLDIDDRINKIL
jgi:uncharacterized HAD superfamily protein